MVTLRIDDIGASSKYYNQHGKNLFRHRSFPVFFFPFANVLFFKRIRPFRKWGIYEELTYDEWHTFLALFHEYGINPIVAITACWVDERSKLIPFPEKFPEEARILRDAAKRGNITIANHGLTHCVVGKHLPRLLHSNRTYHREFWPELPSDLHKDHIERSQSILEEYFQRKITLFVPPGNVWSTKTYFAMQGTNIDTVLCNRYMLDSDAPMHSIRFIDDRKGYVNIHDRELKLLGKPWLEKLIDQRILTH